MGKSKQPTEEPVSVAGKVFFRPVEAKELKGKKIKVYAKVYLDKEKKFKTECLQANDPQFAEQPRLVALKADTPATFIRFAIWRKDSLTNNFLGEVGIPLHHLLDGIPRDRWYALADKKGKDFKKKKGDLRLQVMYLQSDDDITPKHEEFPYPLQTLMRKKQIEQFKKCLKQIAAMEVIGPGEPVEVALGVTDHNGDNALHVACELDLPDCVKELLDQKFSLDDKNSEDGQTPLHKACAKGANTVVQLLLDAGANVNAVDNEGNTPAHVACANNQAEALKLLADKSADLNKQNEEGYTPMHTALASQAKECITLLGEKDVNLFLENKKGLDAATFSYTSLDDVEPGTMKHFFTAVKVTSHREFAVRKNNKFRHQKTLDGVLKDWRKNAQFAFTGKGIVNILVHYDDPAGDPGQPMLKIGYVVIRSKEKTHKEVGYLHTISDYGTKDPLPLMLNGEEDGVVLVYTKGEDLKGDIHIVGYTNDEDISIVEKTEWPHSVMLESEWKGPSACGCIENEKWRENPKYKLTIPEEKEVAITVMLEQAKAAMDLVPFQVLPYQFHIGFYIYDSKNGKPGEIVSHVAKFKNAREVYERVVLDGTAHKEMIVIPCTHKPNQECAFSIAAYSTHAIEFTPL